MEEGTHVWLRTPKSEWGWVPARIVKKELIASSVAQDDDEDAGPAAAIRLTLADDFASLSSDERYFRNAIRSTSGYGRQISGSFESDAEPFTVQITVDANGSGGPSEHPDVKLRNMPASSSNAGLLLGTNSTDDTIGDPPTIIRDDIAGGVDDLIGLTHLHEPAILHALRLRYAADIIYTATGPILLAINPFKSMAGVYDSRLMELYRARGRDTSGGNGPPSSPANDASVATNVSRFRDPTTNDGKNAIPAIYLHRPDGKLPPHVYQTADDAYRSMMRGMETDRFLKRRGGGTAATSSRNNNTTSKQSEIMPANQSILVSGESGAGKTVTTKIVLNYFAMLSRKLQEGSDGSDGNDDSGMSTMMKGTNGHTIANTNTGHTTNTANNNNNNNTTTIEQQILQSNPILEAFGNARTARNDNSSRFGKYINIGFDSRGKLSRASIDTYLLEKVRLIHQSGGERNFHVFYQFMTGSTAEEREGLCLGRSMGVEDFLLTNQSETYDRRDGVKDVDMHREMVEAMRIMNFGEETVAQLMRLVVAILFAGNMKFVSDGGSTSFSESCLLEEDEASIAVAKLLGVTFDKLAAALTTKVLFARGDIIHKGLDVNQAEKANEALIKSIYGAAFDFITEKINVSINAGSGSSENGGAVGNGGRPSLKRSASSTTGAAASIVPPGGASIGVLDIFGFETFEVNNFEQLCINYTNETLQQQFNKFVFKLEQQEYEREGILWKFIPFPDNQVVLDLIDKPQTGILQLLDEQCMVNWGTDDKFSSNLYSKCENHPRFCVGSAQRVRKQFSVEHYAGYVEYTVENWLEKNKDQLPAASVELLESSDFPLIGQIKKYVRSEGSKITSKTLGKQFSESLKILRARIDTTVPHYVRCLKPNDELAPDSFDPKQIVEQLRYCGVLEAVRVSRAGYPTRYPHDVFLSRYYMLCPNRSSDVGNLSPYHDESTGNLSEEQKQLKRLVSRVATDVWRLEHEAHLHQLKAERRHLEVDAPEIQQQPSDVSEENALARPETMDEFLQLDFSSRCAVAGLQLGQTKVFLRRDAFDFIEAIRNQKFGKNVTTISKTWRRYYTRRYYFYSLKCVVRIQCLFRKARARVQTNELMKAFLEYLRLKEASRKISRCYRNHLALNREGAELRQKKNAIVKIQGTMRGRLARREVFTTIKCIIKMQSVLRAIRQRKAFENEKLSVITIQSLARVVIAKHRADEAIKQRAVTAIASVVRMRSRLMDYKRRKAAASRIKIAYRQHLYQERLLYGTFLKRYYMLGNPEDFKKKPRSERKQKIMLARHRNALINEKRQELVKLVNKLSLDIWQPGMFESFSKKNEKQRDAPQAILSFAVGLVCPPPAILSQLTPIPTTKDEFLSRDLSSRYCLAGMQLSHGFVFMRTQTYSRLEATRNTLVAGSSAKIQSAARRKLVVEDLKRKKSATIKIQSILRMVFAKRQLVPMKKEFAATLIQSVWRMTSTKKSVWNKYWSTQTAELFGYISADNWYMVEKMLHKNPLLVEEEDPVTGELPLHKIVERNEPWTLLIDMVLTLYPKAVVHKDSEGALPIHHAAKADNLTALDIIYESYKNGAKDVDAVGRLPIHVAAEHGAVEAVKYLTMKAPHGASSVVLPGSDSGGTLPLHLACKNYSSVGLITALLRSPLHFSLAGSTDENGELPLHLLLRGGAAVDVSAVKTVLTCHLNAISTRDQSGDIPLHIALKSCCKPQVIETLLGHFPGSSVVMDGEGHSPLHLALLNSAEDVTSLSLINHAPQLVTFVDQESGKSPIQVATENELSLFIVYKLLKRDMPIDLNEKVQVRLIPHFFSWNHIMVGVRDRYYQVVSKILQQCTQPQVLALAHVEDADGNIALATATPICRHEVRVMLRLFNTLELVKQRPAFTNAASTTEIFYALRFEPPPEQSDLFRVDYESKASETVDYTEDWDDDMSQMSDSSGPGKKGVDIIDANLSVPERLKLIRNEKGQHVIAKITPRSDIVERELKVRKEFNLSRHYVPSIISVHHTVHHGAYQNASAEPAYCITMEGADATVEHLMLDLRRAGKGFPSNELKRVATSLLHLHENGLVHTDFGPHSVGKFGPLFKMLGVGGCVRVGGATDPRQGIYHPPEAILLETIKIDGKERKTAKVISITAKPSHDIWAFGNMVYEAVAGVPISAYSHRGQRVKSSNLAKIARWDELSLKRALRHIDEDDTLARDVITKLLNPDPAQRFQTIRDVIADPFFNTDAGDRKIKKKTEDTVE